MEVRMISIIPGMTYETVKVTKHANVKGYALGKLLQQLEPRIQWDLMGPGMLSGSFHPEVEYEFDVLGLPDPPPEPDPEPDSEDEEDG